MNRQIRPIAARALLALGMLLAPGLDARADDTALFSTKVPPNVVILQDNSGSMNEIMWHPNYTAAGATCDLFGWVAPGQTVFPDTTKPYTGTGLLNDSTTPTARATYRNCDPNTRHCRFEIHERSANFVSTGTVACQSPPANNRCGTSNAGAGALATGQTSCRSGYIERTFCGNTRRLYIDGENECKDNNTWWSEEYVEWYFSDNADAYVGGLAEGNTSTDATLVDADQNGQYYIDGTRYAQFKRSRITAAKEVARDVLFRVNSNCAAGTGNIATLSCPDGDKDAVRFGVAVFDGGNGGYVRAPIDKYSSNKTSLDAAIDNFDADASTPLAEALFQTYTYFMSRTAANIPFGRDGTTKFPVYSRASANGAHTTTPPGDPLDCDETTTGSQPCRCQRNFVILITDGLPNNDRFDDCGGACPVNSRTLGFDVFGNLIGDYAPDVVGDPPGIGNPENVGIVGGNGYLYLDDVTKFMHDTDFRLDLANTDGAQTLDVYTVGFNIPDGAVNLLTRAAQNANGTFYRARSAGDVSDALVAAIQSIIVKSRSFTSAAVPASRTSSGDNFYSAFFLPAPNTPFWSGHLKNFDFTGAGDILTADGKCAIGTDPTDTPPCNASGALRTDAAGFWDAALEMPDPAARKLYVELASTSVFSQPATFTIPSPVSDAVSWFGIVSTDNLVAPYSTLSPSGTGDMAQALIRYLRGCRFGTDCTERVDSNGDPSYLGDIYHSNPVVVGSPNSPINEASYKTFANTYRTRPRVAYAGANDGFVHGFHAGDWDATLTPPRHDRGTGEELMGFMPHGVRSTVKDFVKSVTGLRTAVLVDGSPVVADAWFNRAVVSGTTLSSTVSPTLTAKLPAQWRTVLIQSLRDGGQHYSALDITNPPASAGDTTTTYPRYLWAFPAESSAVLNGATSSEAAWVGNTWSEPVITRVRVKSDTTGSDPNGYERWVAVFGGGYHTAGDPNGLDYKLPSDAGFTAKGRSIYIVDITTGQVLAKKVFDDAATALDTATAEQVGIQEMRYAIPSAPAVFDTDFDGFADVIYIGDLGGNLWKWVVSEPGDDPIHNTTASDDPAQPNWPFRLFFRGSASTEPPAEFSGSPWSAATHYQSFFFPPTGVLRKGQLALAFGAGERNDPIGAPSDYSDGCTVGTTDPDEPECLNNNHFYVVKDVDPLEKVGTAWNRLTGTIVEIPSSGICPSGHEGCVVDLDGASPSCSDIATAKGYFITGRDAEKFVSNSTIFLGSVFTGSFLPADPSTADICGAKGDSFLYSFDLECGTGKFPGAGSDQDDRRTGIGSGLPTRPRVSVGDLNQGDTSGCVNKIVVVTSDGQIWNDCPGSIPSSGVKVRSWRER